MIISDISGHVLIVMPLSSALPRPGSGCLNIAFGWPGLTRIFYLSWKPLTRVLEIILEMQTL